MPKISNIVKSFVALCSVAGYAATNSHPSDARVYNDCQCYTFDVWFDPMGAQPSQSGLEFAQVDTTSSTGHASSDRFIDPNFAFGFKVGGSVRSNLPNWTFGVQYTWFDKTYSNSVQASGIESGTVALTPRISGMLTGAQINLTDASQSGSVSSSFKYDWDLLDFQAGWSCCVCSGLELTPYTGFRTLWYDTTMQETNKDSAGVVFSEQGDMSDIKTSLSACGFMGGLALKWNLCGSLNFFGSFGGSLLGGSERITAHAVSTGTRGADGNKSFSGKEGRTLHSLEGKLGIDWSWCWCGIDYMVGFYYEAIQLSPVGLLGGSNGVSRVSDDSFLQAVAGRIGMSF